MKIRSNFISLFKFDKTQYSLLYCVMFAFVIFETLSIASNFSLADGFFLLISIIFLVKILRSKVQLYNKYIYPAIFFVISLIGVLNYGATRMFQSQLRFVFYCFIFATLLNYFYHKSIILREKVISSYIYICVIFSGFIVLQYISFYIFHYNLKFEFWENTNTSGYYIYSALTNYRTGGFFNEPSWFAVFTGPVLDISFRRKKNKELVLCIVAMILSTSSLAFLFIALFLFFNVNKSKKYVVLFLLIIVLLYYIFPMAFERFFEALDFGEGVVNSNDARVFNPIDLVISNNIIPLFGVNLDNLYLSEGMFFANTFIFVYLTFGVVGLIVFVRMLSYHQSLYMTSILLATVVIEGCYGRPDFWMALFATSVHAITPLKKSTSI